jgi:predicted aspartyl protease
LGRPAVKIQIHGVPGTANIDSGARTSLASAQLYHILTERGHKFLPTTVQLVQADGSSTLTNVKTATLPVKLQGKEIETTFITIPDAHETTTLLGIDFLRKAGLVINYAHSRWHFSGQRHQTYGFVAKDQTQKDTQMAAMQTDSIVSFQSTVPQQRTPQRVDTVMQMEQTLRHR